MGRGWPSTMPTPVPRPSSVPAGRPVGRPRPPWYRGLLRLTDRAYRAVHRLDRPTTQVGPVLQVVVRRVLRPRRLPDGTALRAGDRVGILHLANDRVTSLQGDPHAGLRVRRLLVESLRVLASETRPQGRFAAVRAYAATTVFHQGLARLGFRPEPDGWLTPRLVGAYQRALLAVLAPGLARRPTVVSPRARRCWLSAGELAARYGGAPPGGPWPSPVSPEPTQPGPD